MTDWSTLALKHLPSQLLKQKRWSELEEWLTSLEFIEAKCLAGMVRELISDFDNAERVAPPQLQTEIKEWEQAHFFANWEEPPSPDHGIRTERWAQCRQFISLEAHNFERHLGQYRGLVLQQGFNQPKDGYVSAVSRRLILSRRPAPGPWIERINRATTFHASACRRIHQRSAAHLLILPDDRALSAAADYSLELWDLETGSEIFRLRGHEGKVTGVALAGGDKAVSASTDGSLRIWELASGRCLHVLRGQGNELRFAVQGDRIISGPESGAARAGSALRVWDVESGECLAELRGKQSGINRIVPLQPNHVASIGSDNSLQVWELSSGRCVTSIEGHHIDDTSYEVVSDERAVSYIGRPYAREPTAPRNYAVRIWNLTTGQCEHVLEGPSRPQQVKAALRGRAFCVSYEDSIEVRDTTNGERRFSFRAPNDGGVPNGVGLLAISPDGEKAICADGPNRLLVWDLLHGEHFRTLRGEGIKPPIAWTADGLVLCATNDHSLHVWDLESGAHLRTLRGHVAPISGLVLASSGTVVSVSEDRTVRVWDVEASGLRKWPETLSAHGSSPRLLPDGRALTVSGKTISVWNLETGGRDHVLEGHTSEVFAVEPTPDGRLVSASTDDTLRVWNLTTGQCERTMRDPSGRLSHLALIPDQRAVTTSDRGFLRVWDLSNGEFTDTSDRHGGAINRLQLLPDNRALTLGRDGDVRVWDLASGRSLQTLVVNPEIMLAPEPVVLEGNRVLTVGKDYTMSVWQLSTGERLHTLEGHSDRIAALAVASHDRAVSVSLDKSVRVWELGSGRCLHLLRADETSNPEHQSPYRVKVAADGRIVVGYMGGSSLVWDIESGDFLGYADGAVFTNVTQESQGDPGSEQLPSWESSESGFTWRPDGEDGGCAFYPLNGQPAVACDLRQGRALLTEHGSDEIHILRLNRTGQSPAEFKPKSTTVAEGVADGAKPLTMSEWVGSLKIESLFDRSLKPASRLKDVTASLVVLLLLFGVVALGIWLGSLNAWLWLIAAPLAGLGLLGLLSSVLMLVRDELTRGTYTLCVEALKLRAAGSLEAALSLLNKAESDSKKRNNSEGRATILFEQAGVLEESGQWQAALKCLEEAEPIFEGMSQKLFYKRCLLAQWQILEKNELDPQRIVKVLSTLANRLLEEGDRESAMRFVLQGQKAAARTGSFEEILKATLFIPKEFQTSDELLEELKKGASKPIPDSDFVEEIITNRHVSEVAERVVSEMYHDDRLALLDWRAKTLLQANDYSRALETYTEYEQAARETHDEKNELAGLASRAVMLAELGRIKEALELAERAEEFARRVQDKACLSLVLERHASMLMESQGDLNQALSLLDELQQTARELSDTETLLRAFNMQARVHESRKEYPAAFETLRAQERLLRELGRHEELLMCLGQQALNLLNIPGGKQSAEETYGEVESLARALNRSDYVGFALVNRALIKEEKYGLYAEALGDLREAGELFRRLGMNENVSKVDQNIIFLRARAHEFMKKSFDLPAEALLERGDVDGALRLIEEQVLFCRQMNEPESLAKALAVKALVLTDILGRPDAAAPLLEEAYEIARADDLEELADQIKELRQE